MPQHLFTDPDLKLRVDGRTHRPIVRDGDARFQLTLPASTIILLSRSGRPDELGRGTDDRRLGFAVTGITLETTASRIEIGPEHPGLIEGFYPCEFAEGSTLRWTNGAGLLPGSLFTERVGPAWLTVRGQGLPCYPRRSTTADAALLDRFESLGADCEFGFVQRHFGIEPISLLRWVGTDLGRLVRGLRDRFEGMGDPDWTRLEWDAAASEYKLRDPSYFDTHSMIFAPLPPDTLERARLASCARLQLLRRKLLHDIEAGRRIFVFKSALISDDDAPIRALSAALHAIGPAPLLYVTPPATPPGHRQVHQRAARTFSAEVQRVPSGDGPDGSIDHAEWRRICQATVALVDRGAL